jgi:Zn-dependent protease with chaperone function
MQARAGQAGGGGRGVLLFSLLRIDTSVLRPTRPFMWAARRLLLPPTTTTSQTSLFRTSRTRSIFLPTHKQSQLSFPTARTFNLINRTTTTKHLGGVVEKAHPPKRLVSKLFGPKYAEKARFTFWKHVKRHPFSLVVGFGVVVLLPASLLGYSYKHQDQVPISGRTRVMDVTWEEEQQYALSSFRLLKQTYSASILPPDHPIVVVVKRVGKRLVKQSGLQNLEWEFLVIENDERNAFVLPGGKICVFTGILDVAQTEGGLAAILSHEIGHLVARHSAEKWTHERWHRVLAWLASLIWSNKEPGWAIEHFLYVTLALPFSRKLELEADHIGLVIMAKACYDPREMLRLWQRFRHYQPNGDQFVYLSTHPSDEKRARYTERYLTEALSHCHHCPTIFPPVSLLADPNGQQQHPQSRLKIDL